MSLVCPRELYNFGMHHMICSSPIENCFSVGWGGGGGGGFLLMFLNFPSPNSKNSRVPIDKSPVKLTRHPHIFFYGISAPPQNLGTFILKLSLLQKILYEKGTKHNL